MGGGLLEKKQKNPMKKTEKTNKKNANLKKGASFFCDFLF